MLNADYKDLETKYNNLRIKTKEIIDMLLDENTGTWYDSAFEVCHPYTTGISGREIENRLKQLKSII